MTHTRETALQRLEELSALDQGWLNGDGAPIHSQAIENSQDFINLSPETLLSNYHIYPTENGAISLEISGLNDLIFYDITIDSTCYSISRIYMNGDESEDLTFTEPVEAIHTLQAWFQDSLTSS